MFFRLKEHFFCFRNTFFCFQPVPGSRRGERGAGVLNTIFSVEIIVFRFQEYLFQFRFPVQRYAIFFGLKEEFFGFGLVP